MSTPNGPPDPLDVGIQMLVVECGFRSFFVYIPEKQAKGDEAPVTAMFFALDETSLKAAAMEVLALGKPPSDHGVV